MSLLLLFQNNLTPATRSHNGLPGGRWYNESYDEDAKANKEKRRKKILKDDEEVLSIIKLFMQWE